MFIFINFLSLISCFSIFKVAVLLIPPAQLTKRYPSSSLSKFISILPSICSLLIAIAPDIPVSSSVVINTSIGGCGMSFEANIAIA